MLFNSHLFIFVFLPLVLLGFHLCSRFGGARGATVWLVLASLFFYGCWSLRDLALIVILTLFNYLIGVVQAQSHATTGKGSLRFMWLGLVVDLGVLAYCKYAGFFVDTLASLSRAKWHFMMIALPLGISFYTFQKIAYVVDAYRGRTKGVKFLDFCLFVTFFPQLIAGPINHHAEMIPQFRGLGRRFDAGDLAVGLTIFTFGLAKKLLIADHLAAISDNAYSAITHGVLPGALDAWLAALAFTVQIYFDFSGYSDMAVGLARMFGLRLPLNFASPLKSHDFSEFWQRWHITLSRFLREYLYASLGGNRIGNARRYFNVWLTMVLSGLWHGAAWTYVIWGALHGAMLVINHGWRSWRKARSGNRGKLAPSWWSMPATFLLFALSLVIFRAPTLTAAGGMFAAMAGAGVHSRVESLWLAVLVPTSTALWSVALGLFLVFAVPDTMRLLAVTDPVLDGAAVLAPVPGWLSWRPNTAWAAVTAVLAIACLFLLDQPVPFIYFQF
jgi:D-alanyl-lipoteichoic acid acyltransferase DltB (MBOAT superfamily)